MATKQTKKKATPAKKPAARVASNKQTTATALRKAQNNVRLASLVVIFAVLCVVFAVVAYYQYW